MRKGEIGDRGKGQFFNTSHRQRHVLDQQQRRRRRRRPRRHQQQPPMSLLDAHRAFPKHTHPAESVAETRRARQYVLSRPDSGSSGTYNLGVYSLSPHPEHSDVLLPSDPLCLLALLAVISRMETAAKFPSLEDDISVQCPSKTGVHAGVSTVSVLSFNAALDDQLPILVEDDIDKREKHITRKIQHTHVINALTCSKLSTSDHLIYSLLNSQLFDYFVLHVLQQDDSTILKYYSLMEHNFPQTLQKLTPLTATMASKVRAHLTKRNDFNLRNPNTHAYFASIVAPKYSYEAYISESARIRRDAKDLLLELNESYSAALKDSDPSVIDLQVASYIYSLSYMAAEVDEYPALVNFSRQIIDKFV